MYRIEFSHSHKLHLYTGTPTKKAYSFKRIHTPKCFSTKINTSTLHNPNSHITPTSSSMNKAFVIMKKITNDFIFPSVSATFNPERIHRYLRSGHQQQRLYTPHAISTSYQKQILFQRNCLHTKVCCWQKFQLSLTSLK